MKISILAAVAENGVIGRGGALPWRLSGDLRRFKQLTMGHTIVMGRRTWQSIDRALPGRRTVVVSRQPGYSVDAAGVTVAASLEEALRGAEASAETEAFIVGGAELYREALPHADGLYLTRVHADVAGDTFFPPFDLDLWRLTHREDHPASAENEHPFSFEVYRRP